MTGLSVIGERFFTSLRSVQNDRVNVLDESDGFVGVRGSKNGRAALVLLLLICFLGFGLRIYRLDGQSLWNDEGLSVFRAGQSLPVILTNTITIDNVDTIDTNPPLYFLVLHYWAGLAGETVFALRFLGVLFGVLNIPLIFRLGRYLHSTAVGLAAAFFLAISPFHIWQSQEMRNYSLLLLFNMLSVYGLFRFVLDDSRKWRWLIVWGAAAVAGVYTHYFGAFVLAFGGLVVVWAVVRGRDWRRWLRPRFGVPAALLILLSIPIFWMGLSRFQAGRQIDFTFVPFHHLLSHAGSAYAAGIVYGFVQPLWRTLPAVLLAAAGLVIPGWRGRRGLTPTLLIGYMLVPFLLLLLLSAVNPLYNGPRHLLMGLLPFLLLVGGGMVALPGKWRIPAVIIAILAVFIQADWLEAQFNAPELVKDDLRGLAAYLEQVAGPEDVIVLHDSISGVTFDYYYDGAASWTAVPLLSQANVAAAVERLSQLGQEARRVWFVTEPAPRTGFPRDTLKEWAIQNWPKLYDLRFASLWLSLNLEVFVPHPETAELPASAIIGNVNWSGELTLVGIDSPTEVMAGGFWQPDFYWSQQQAHPEGYDMSLRLTDEAGQIWYQVDDPLWVRYGPGSWPVDQIVRYGPVLSLPAGLPPGEYQVRLRLSRTADNQPLPANGQQIEWLVMPALTITAAQAPGGLARLPEHTALEKSFDGQMRLVGFNIPSAAYRPGHIVPISLFWHILDNPRADYQLQLQLVEEDGTVLNEASSPPTRADYPTGRWQPGEIIQGRADLIIPATAEAGQYTIRAGLLNPETGDYLTTGGLFGRSLVELTTIEVAAWNLETDLPPVETVVEADFGRPSLVTLYGYDLSNDKSNDISSESAAPGDFLNLTLVWQSLTAEIPANYTVFVHLADEDERIVDQGDGVPVNGFRPTTGWRRNEVIADEHLIAIPPETAPGSYLLWIGFYDPGTDIRLEPSVDGVIQPNGRLLLTEITITP